MIEDILADICKVALAENVLPEKSTERKEGRDPASFSRGKWVTRPAGISILYGIRGVRGSERHRCTIKLWVSFQASHGVQRAYYGSVCAAVMWTIFGYQTESLMPVYEEYHT